MNLFYSCMGNQLPAFTYKEIKTYFHKHPRKADHVQVKTFSVRFCCHPGEPPISISSLQPPFNATRGERAILDSVVLDGRTLMSKTRGVRVILTGSTAITCRPSQKADSRGKPTPFPPSPSLPPPAPVPPESPLSSSSPPSPAPAPPLTSAPVASSTLSPPDPLANVAPLPMSPSPPATQDVPIPPDETPEFVGVPVAMNKEAIFKRVQKQLGWQRGLINEVSIAPGTDDFAKRDILFQRGGVSSSGLAYLLGSNMPLTFREGLKITNDPLIRLIIEKSLLDEKCVIPFPISTGIPELQLDPTNVPVYVESSILGLLCNVIKEQVSDKITWLKDEGGIGFRVHWPETCSKSDILILSFTVTYILHQDVS